MSSFESIFKSGLEAINNNDLAQAEILFNEALALDPSSATCQVNLGMLKLSQQKVEEAIHFLESALKLDPKIIQAYQNLGSCYLFKGEIDKAEEIYLKSLQFDPENFASYHNLSTMYMQTQQFAKAKKTFEKLIHIDPEDYHASFMLGMVFLTLKEYYPAIANFLYTLKIKDDYHNARMALAEALYRFGRFKASMKELDYLISELPEMVTPYVRKALFLIESGDHAGAIPFLERANALDGKNIEILEIMAVICEEFGQKENAENLYKQILIIEPEYKSALQALERLANLEKIIGSNPLVLNNEVI